MVKKREQEAVLLDDQVDDRNGRDFLGLLLKAKHDADEAKKISIDELIDECKTFYVAGQETTASAICWTILILATHKDWQGKVRNEVLELFSHQNPNANCIPKRKTMSMVIPESLQLYFPTVYVLRKAAREIKLGKLTVPADMMFYIPFLTLHHNPEIWGEDAHVFKQERFAEGVAKATGNNMVAFSPFGLGPRNCVGSNFELTEMKIVLSMILKKFRITLSPTYEHSLGYMEFKSYPTHSNIKKHWVIQETL